MHMQASCATLLIATTFNSGSAYRIAYLYLPCAKQLLKLLDSLMFLDLCDAQMLILHLSLQRLPSLGCSWTEVASLKLRPMGSMQIHATLVCLLKNSQVVIYADLPVQVCRLQIYHPIDPQLHGSADV